MSVDAKQLLFELAAKTWDAHVDLVVEAMLGGRDVAALPPRWEDLDSGLKEMFIAMVQPAQVATTQCVQTVSSIAKAFGHEGA